MAGIITANEIEKLRNDLDDGKGVDVIAVRAALAYIEHLEGLCRESLELIDATWSTATPLSAKLRRVVMKGTGVSLPRASVGGEMTAKEANLILASQHILHVMDSDAPSEVWYEAVDRLRDATDTATSKPTGCSGGSTPGEG